MASHVEVPRPQRPEVKRTIWGHWPVLLSLVVAIGMTSQPGLALVPVAILIGLSALIASRLPNGWEKHLAMWSAFAATIVIAISSR